MADKVGQYMKSEGELKSEVEAANTALREMKGAEKKLLGEIAALQTELSRAKLPPVRADRLDDSEMAYEARIRQENADRTEARRKAFEKRKDRDQNLIPKLVASGGHLGPVVDLIKLIGDPDVREKNGTAICRRLIAAMISIVVTVGHLLCDQDGVGGGRIWD